MTACQVYRETRDTEVTEGNLVFLVRLESLGRRALMDLRGR